MLILLGAILGLAISPPFYILSAFGAILTFIGLFAGTDKETGASDRQNEIAVFEKYEYLKMLITRLAEERDRYSSLVGNGIEEWNDQLRELDREIAVLEREYSVKSAELSNSDLISAKRDNLSAKLEEYRREHKILQASEKLLTEAYENMCAKYLGKASAAFRKYTDLLGGGDGYALDLSFRVTKTECGKTRENDY